jgi:hypothetical protein
MASIPTANASHTCFLSIPKVIIEPRIMPPSLTAALILSYRFLDGMILWLFGAR